MELFESIWFLNPNKSWQVPELIVVVDIDTYFGPLIAYTIIRIKIVSFFQWWELGTQLLGDLIHDKYTFTFFHLSDDRMSVINSFHNIINNPGNYIRWSIDAVLCFYLRSQIINSVRDIDRNVNSEVFISGSNMVGLVKEFKFNIVYRWNW